MFDAMDVGILSFVIAALAVEWSLTPGEMGWIGSVNSIGMAVGALVFGVFADKVGRKKIFMITLLLFSIASGLICSNNFARSIFGSSIFCWNGTWWRVTSCFNISI